MKRARILLADDHSLIVEGFRTVLEPHYEIVGAVSDGRSLVEEALRLNPDLIVLDITMPLLNGIEAARQIRKRLPRAKLLFVTMHISPVYLREALHAGASGYVLKSSAREEILTAVERVLSGQVYITPGFAGESLDQYKDGEAAGRALASRTLSAREREILQLVAEGNTAKQIAFALNISIKTVGFHKDNVKSKLGLRTTAELTRYAIEEGLV